MAVVLIVMIITAGIVCYHAVQQESHIVCSCGAELKTANPSLLSSFQSRHTFCRY